MLSSRVWRSLVSTFWRYSLSSPDSGVAATGSNKTVMTQLDNILDEVPASWVAEGQSPDPSTVEDKEQALYEEHAARIKAEAEASASQRRFLVASQQMAEYLDEKAADLRALSTEAEGLSAATEQADSLQTSLAATATDLETTAGHFRTECEAAKRSLAEVQPEGTDLSSPKRKREGDMEVDGRQQRQEEEGSDEDDNVDGHHHLTTNGSPVKKILPSHHHDSFRERAKYIPLRLDSEERRLLRLLEAALSVSEYTDKVDILTWRSKTARVHAQVKDICAILCGLVVAQDYRRGQKLIAQRDFASLATFFQDVFEVGRRHKIMNPERMRDTYGKLIYMLMDASEPEVQDLLEFDCVRPLRTVYTLLENANKLDVLDDPLLETATAEIGVAPGVPRHEIQRRIKAKERAREAIARRHRSATLSEEDLLRCMYSISDNNAFLLYNRDPVDKLIAYLKTHFPQERPTSSSRSLAIQGGAAGARLTHSHERQYTYVIQSLTLWREISHEMFKLWSCADADMLEARNYYRLQNTGQGLQRVQAAPRVGKAMAAILARCQQRLGGWVGSSVVHLGDHNVPNALMFIDKYTQVPRILGPLSLVLDRLPALAGDPNLARYMESLCGSPTTCRQVILQDFFRHAFDGSGADNFFDAGSCIDGRLTSAWNWCSKLEKKQYYHLFALAGFQGFDGDFK